MAASSRGQRLLLSMPLFAAFVLLGTVISALGPSIAAFARTVHRPETDFGTVFAARGIGYFLGSCVAGHRLFSRSRFVVLGCALMLMGACAIGISFATSYAVMVCLNLLEGLGCGSLEVPANVAIVKIHGEAVGPWMQTLHFCFSAGALLSPFVVAAAGPHFTYALFGALSLPVAAGSIWAGMQPRVKALDDDPKCSDCNGEESNGSAVTEMVALVDSSGNGDAEQQQQMHEERTVTDGAVADPSKQESSENGSHVEAAANGFEQQQLTDGHEPGSSSNGSKSNGKSNGSDSSINKSNNSSSSSSEAATLLIPMNGVVQSLLVLFLFFYVGIEVGFGGWIPVVTVLRGATESQGAYTASMFWAGVTIGRVVSIPLAVMYTTKALLQGTLIGSVVVAIAIWFGSGSYAGIMVGSLAYGLCLSAMYPLAMSLPVSMGVELSSATASRAVGGAALGEMLIPLLTGVLIDAQGPPALNYLSFLGPIAMIAAFYAFLLGTSKLKRFYTPLAQSSTNQSPAKSSSDQHFEGSNSSPAKNGHIEGRRRSGSSGSVELAAFV